MKVPQLKFRGLLAAKRMSSFVDNLGEWGRLFDKKKLIFKHFVHVGIYRGVGPKWEVIKHAIDAIEAIDAIDAIDAIIK